MGKAFSKTGKMFVVAFYFPIGNIVDKFQVRLKSIVFLLNIVSFLFYNIHAHTQFNVLPPTLEEHNVEDNNNK